MFDFHRQKPIGNYIVDFFCNELMLALEIDGHSHQDKYEADMNRRKDIGSLGITVLRFNDLDVKKDMDNVLHSIEGWILDFKAKKIHTPKSPLERGLLNSPLERG